VAKILPEILGPGADPGLPNLFFDLLHTPEVKLSLPPGFPPTQPIPSLLGSENLQAGLEFLIKISLNSFL
jgi:hypothetical protein